MPKILIMGAGGFGTALAVMSHKIGHDITLWSPFLEEVSRLSLEREHKKLLPGVIIPIDVTITSSLDNPSQYELIIICTPSFAVRSSAKALRESGIESKSVVVCAAKGLEWESGKTMTDIIADELPLNSIVALSGPSHAEEVARDVPTSIVAASRSRNSAAAVQDILMNESLRIYISDDVPGVEYGGALKNVIALAAGVLDGLGIGDNAKAALMTRGMAEISRLGISLGAKAETFFGLSGMGDLIVTCSSMHSRNRRCGILIGQGVPPKEAVEKIGMTVEGYLCTKSAYELSIANNIDMPIVKAAYRVLYEGLPVMEAIRSLMDRPKRHESETIWLLQKQ